VKLQQAPQWVLKVVGPTTAIFVAWKAATDAQIRDLQRRVNTGEKPADDKPTTFHQLLDPNAADRDVVPPCKVFLLNIYLQSRIVSWLI